MVADAHRPLLRCRDTRYAIATTICHATTASADYRSYLRISRHVANILLHMPLRQDMLFIESLSLLSAI